MLKETKESEKFQTQKKSLLRLLTIGSKVRVLLGSPIFTEKDGLVLAVFFYI